MLTGVIQIGEYVYKNRDQTRSELDDIIENPNDNGKYKHVFKVIFQKTSDGLNFKEIGYEEFSEKRLSKYAYKKGSGARGGDCTPTSKLTEASRTINNIKSPIKNIIEGSCDVKSEELELFKGLFDEYSASQDKITNSLEEIIKSSSIPKGESAFITITIIDNDKELYVGDFDIVKKRLTKIGEEQFYTKYGKESRGTGTCYYCKKQTEVYGFAGTYKCYTLDKIGFVTGGFDQSKAWMNYPVCGDCARILELGKKYIDEFLTSKFSGFDYLVVPKFTLDLDDSWEEVRNELEKFEKCEKFSTSEDVKNNLMQSEKDFLSIMTESNNYMNYNLLLFREENAAYRILLYVEDVIPSKLKRLLKVKDEIDKISVFKNLPGKDKTPYDLRYGFDKLRHFFPNNKMEGNYDKSFLELMNNIFSTKPISYNFLLGRMVEKIQELFSREEYTDTSVLYALMNILYLKKLGLFNISKDVKCMNVERNEKNSIYIDFMDNYKDILDSDYKRAVFLEGVLVDKLLNIQYLDKKSKPFYSRLNGLKLNDKLVKRIFTEAINKLNEYDKNYYTELEALIGTYMLSKNDMTDDEISYFFALGLTLSKNLKDKKVEGEMTND
ncbi:MAG: CRISPR-associated protein (cas_TM1802) [Firmicutes bacterium ADurb.Bin419]|nr:MAG: CRISPR-associated protein (cas_TM1802) [Firmicutes bacterium ADurb.Bin419]